MRTCAECGGATANPRFCSKGCAAAFNNRAAPKRVAVTGTCRHCGAVVSRSRVYCSNECQHAYERARRTEAWLAGGAVNPRAEASNFVRRFLLDAQAGVCAICSGPPVWNGRPLVFVLDHINGNGSDHRRENLRLVCPNCDSQLPTFKSRNRGRGRFVRRLRYAQGLSS